MKLAKKMISLLSAVAIISTLFMGITASAAGEYLAYKQNDATEGTTLVIDLIAGTNMSNTAITSITSQLDLSPIKNFIVSGSHTIVVPAAIKGSYIAKTGRYNLSYADADGFNVSAGDVIATMTLNLSEELSQDYTFSTIMLTCTAGGSIYTTNEKTPNATLIDPEEFIYSAPKPAATIDSITIDPKEATVNGGKTQTFAVVVEGTGDFDSTYTLTAPAGSFVGDTFTAPEATEKEQVITITATANGDKSKTATATVTVPAKEEPPVTEEPTKVVFGNEGKAIFFDSEAKEYTLGTDMYINITSDEDGKTKKFGHQYFWNNGFEGGGTITATFGVVADDKYADGNFSFEIINNNN